MTLNNPTAPVVSPTAGGARTAGYAGSLVAAALTVLGMIGTWSGAPAAESLVDPAHP